MLLELPLGTPPIYYNGINLFWEIASIVFFFFSMIILLKKKEEELETARKIKMGYAFFMFFYSFCRIFFIVAVKYPDEAWNANSYDFFVVCGYFFSSLAFMCIIIVIEKYLITKTHHLFSILACAMVVLYSLCLLGIFGIDSQDLALTLSYVSSPVLTAVIVIMYIYLAVKGTADLRKKALLILFGIALIGIGAIIDGEKIVINAVGWFSSIIQLDMFYSIAPMIMIVGVLIFLKFSY
nr:hypothetical protein [Candidatus Sigynarchaeota archaeon]